MSKDPIALFESVISKDPQAFLSENDPVYQITSSEVREFARQLLANAVKVPHVQLKAWHRNLDACQKVIWLAGCRPQVPGGFDPAYCTDAQHSLKEIEATLALSVTDDQPVAYGAISDLDKIKSGALWSGTLWGTPPNHVVLEARHALYARPFDTTEVLGLLELMAGVCERAQWLIDQTSQVTADDAEQSLSDALDACNEVPPIDDANERDGWLTVYDRLRNILK